MNSESKTQSPCTYIKLYTDQTQHFLELCNNSIITGRQALVLICCMAQYQATGKSPPYDSISGSDDMMVLALFSAQKSRLDATRTEYQRRCVANSQNARKRWDKETSKKTGKKDVKPNNNEPKPFSLKITKYRNFYRKLKHDEQITGSVYDFESLYEQLQSNCWTLCGAPVNSLAIVGEILRRRFPGKATPHNTDIADEHRAQLMHWAIESYLRSYSAPLSSDDLTYICDMLATFEGNCSREMRYGVEKWRLSDSAQFAAGSIHKSLRTAVTVYFEQVGQRCAAQRREIA